MAKWRALSSVGVSRECANSLLFSKKFHNLCCGYKREYQILNRKNIKRFDCCADAAEMYREHLNRGIVVWPYFKNVFIGARYEGFKK